MGWRCYRTVRISGRGMSWKVVANVEAYGAAGTIIVLIVVSPVGHTSHIIKVHVHNKIRTITRVSQSSFSCC
jgi:hypothetical protein